MNFNKNIYNLENIDEISTLNNEITNEILKRNFYISENLIKIKNLKPIF